VLQPIKALTWTHSQVRALILKCGGFDGLFEPRTAGHGAADGARL